MKVKKMRIKEILRRFWLFSANKIKSYESVSKQPTQLLFKFNSSLRQKLGTNILQQILIEKDPVGLKNAVVYPHSGFVIRLMNWGHLLLCIKYYCLMHGNKKSQTFNHTTLN